MSGAETIVEIGRRIERRRREHTERLSKLARTGDFEPPCQADCSGWIHYDDGDDRLYGQCPLYEVVPPCIIPKQRHDDLLWEMEREGWPRKYADATWVDMNSEVAPILKKWLESWEHGTPRRRGLLLHGPVGTGKSSAMGVAARHLWPRFPVLFTAWGEYDRWLAFDNYDQLRRLRGARMLAVDDFGTVDYPEWLMARFDSLVEHRYSQQKPFLITTNLSPDTMRKEPEWQRFIDRWRETMLAVSMPGQSMRTPG